MSEGIKIVARNKAAYHNYFIEDTIEAGLVLMGSEIKSVRAGRVQLREAYVREKDGELWLLNAHIADYTPAAQEGHEPLRPRKLLLHKREIAKLMQRVREKGKTIVPTQMYLKDGRAKVEIAVGTGKKLYDKRDTLAKKDTERRIARELGRRR